MNLENLQALLEFDDFVFHHNQIERFKNNDTHRHSKMSKAQQWLLDNGLIEILGDEFHLTNHGRETLEITYREFFKMATSV